MSLTLSEGLREARNLPPFNGSSDYALTNYIRDVNTILSLVAEEIKPTIKSVLANRLQGRALKSIETLLNPTWEQILIKLTEEFGVKESFFKLRTDAMNVSAANHDELVGKLTHALNLMNTKYNLNPENCNMFTPGVNEKIIFDIYLDLLPLNIKTLLIQNNITTISKACTYYMENNLTKDIYLRGKKGFNSRNKNWNKNQTRDNHGRQNFDNRTQNNLPANGFNQNNNGYNQNGNGQYQEPMDIENVNVRENFHMPPQDPNYQ